MSAANSPRAEYERLVDQVGRMTYEELQDVVDSPGYQPAYDECDHCPSWPLCWHRVAEDRLLAVQVARQATLLGEIPYVARHTAEVAGDLMPAGVTVGSGLSLHSSSVKHVRPGDFLRNKSPLPGVDDLGFFVEVLTVEEAADAVVVTVCRTNDPEAIPVEYRYPITIWVNLARPM